MSAFEPTAIEDVTALLRQIERHANEIWYLDGRQYIKVRRGKRTVQIMVWVDDGDTQSLPEPTKALADRWG